MPNFTAGTSFTDGVTNDVTAAKLNALVADAVPTSSLSLNSTTGTISLFSSGTGTAATPAIQPTGDTNTGIFFPAADTIAFSEGGAEAMRINSSGQVGIGIDEPNAKLFVRAGSSPNSAQLLVGYLDGSENYYDANTHYFRNGSAGEVMRINSGNVGIGNTPSQKLDVNGASAIRGTLFLGDGSSSVIRKLTSSTPLTFANNSGSAEMTIDSSGNVGIGTTSPATKLTVSGTNGTNSELRVVSTGANTGGRVTLYENTSGCWEFATSGGANSSLTVKDLFNNTERLRIDSSGNCSIGTATALSRLHIHGDLTLSNATTAVTASTSTITPPATVAGYLTVSINGTSRKIPYYAT